MLYDLSWIANGKSFPPVSEHDRLQSYKDHKDLFDSKHSEIYKNYGLRVNNTKYQFSNSNLALDLGFSKYDRISFETIFNYQRLMSLKMADLVAGEYPVITTDRGQNASKVLNGIRERVDFDEKNFATVIDMSRYGEAVWRIFLDESGKYDFAVWDPAQWFPIVNIDGTNRIVCHCLIWREQLGTEEHPLWECVVQKHYVGYYLESRYKMDGTGAYFGRKMYEDKRVETGLKINAVMHLKSFTTSDTVYGHSDYEQIDSIIAELQCRIQQISTILDKHSSPSMTGPASLLRKNPKTGERTFRAGEYYAVGTGDQLPKYMTWDGQLEAAFKQVELLLDQLYILSEMGRTLISATPQGFQATSGAALRTALISPLAKARRISNSLSIPVKRLIAALSTNDETSLELVDLTVSWSDGLPNDPREQIELVKLATGEDNIMPVDVAVVELLGRTPKEAKDWAKEVKKAKESTDSAASPDTSSSSLSSADSEGDKPGPEPGVNILNKGSKFGLNNFKSPKNEKVDGR